MINCFIIHNLLNLKLIYSSICGGVHDLEIDFIDTEVEDKRNLQSNWNPIRIYFDYEDLKNRNISLETQVAIKQILSRSNLVFQTLIQVVPIKNKLALSKCGNLTISSNLKEGVEADLIVIASYNSSESKEIEAYSGLCGQDKITGRPLAGYVTFTKNLDISKVNWLEYNTYISIHELTHVMVFNQRLFSFFKDEKGKSIPLNNTISNKTVNNLTRLILKSPKVIFYAKRHFNCNDIEGLELENQGGRGTIFNHWEARLMMTDYMIGFGYDDNTISEMTLALFEDSGWYKVNYYTGGLFRWGKGEGCSFLNTSCITNGSIIFNNEYCLDKKMPTCSNSRISKGICSLQNSNNTNSSYNYNTDIIGSLELGDYCPISKSQSVKNYYLGLNCVFGINTFKKEFEETISNNSACFISSLFDNKNKAICYEYKCDYSNKSIIINIGKYNAICPINGGLAKVDEIAGVIYCPDFNRICTKRVDCNSMVDCAFNKVIADPDSFVFNYERIYIPPTGESILLPSFSEYKTFHIFLIMLILIIII